MRWVGSFAESQRQTPDISRNQDALSFEDNGLCRVCVMSYEEYELAESERIIQESMQITNRILEEHVRRLLEPQLNDPEKPLRRTTRATLLGAIFWGGVGVILVLCSLARMMPAWVASAILALIILYGLIQSLEGTSAR
jgi:hypothetical protein